MKAAGHMIEKQSLIIVCVFSLLMQVSTSQAETVVTAVQGKCVCMDLADPCTADTVQTDARLRTRSSDNTNYKSWLQFDLNAVYAAHPDMKGQIQSAMLTFTGTADNTQPKLYVVNGLNDAAGMENWNPATLTWNNAPGNNIADSTLDPSVTTANLYTGTIQPGDGVTDSRSTSGLVSFLNTDSDGLVTFIMTPGWTTYFYNAGSNHPPTLTLSMIPGAYYKTYFVAPDGNDTTGDGSIGSPYQTIGKAVGEVSEGDTIYLRGGTHNYAEAITISSSINGAPDAPITMQNYQDEPVILDFSGQPYESGYPGIRLNGDYWHFKGFTVQHTDSTAINVTGSHNILERLVTVDNGDTGLNLYAPASYNQVINCDSSFNYDPEENGQDADGFGAKGPTGGETSLGPGNVFRSCRSWNNSDDGFDFWWAGNGVRVENCRAWSNGENVWGDPDFTGNGNGFKLGQGGGEHVLIRCLAYNQSNKGFDLNRSTTDATGVTLYHCTGVQNLADNFRFLNPTTGAVHVLRNNVSYGGTETIGTLIVNSHNTWNTGFSVSASDFASLDANGLDGPRAPDGGLPKLSFMRPFTGSALIDVGMDVGLDYEEAGPDLGAYEWLAGDCAADGVIDAVDLECLAMNWLLTECGVCDGADFDGNTDVNLNDFVSLAHNWLKAIE
ncbi:MAG: right-handed parallel beta-helix repeat-containing protein [Sedimentisphaerales bacterium]|nr:right-handed parallel beta-helix repeat-containing protein [Sedimentisphaerales bacterium]